MNCAELNLLLHAYADGELDVMRSLEVEQHVNSCAACAAKLNSLKSLSSAFKESDLAYSAPTSLRRNLQRMTRPAREEVSSPVFNMQWIWKWLAVTATTVATLAILLRPAGISSNDAMMNEVVSAHVRSLMAEHLTDVLSSDKHTVKPWFAGKLDFSPTVTDFATQDFPLIGGRLDYINGRNVAALVYQHNKHFINVFIWPSTKDGGLSEENYHGYNVVTFDANGFHFCLVSDMEPDGLKQLAGLLEDKK